MKRVASLWWQPPRRVSFTLRTGSPAQNVIDEWATAKFPHRVRSSRHRSVPQSPRCGNGFHQAKYRTKSAGRVARAP